jgi:hypothetical protein
MNDAKKDESNEMQTHVSGGNVTGRQRLVGTWTFVSCVARSSDGGTSHPWGEDSFGYLTYTPDGHVFVSRMSAALRARGPELPPSSAESVQAAAEGFESYCGKYDVEDDRVIHAVELCSTPAFCGTKQTRHFVVEGDTLSLTTAPVVEDGVSHVAHLVWRRASPSVSA